MVNFSSLLIINPPSPKFFLFRHFLRPLGPQARSFPRKGPGAMLMGWRVPSSGPGGPRHIPGVLECVGGRG